MMKDEKHFTGFVAMVGRPNVGKSTLTNSLIGEKIVIMSNRPQTTRNKIMCIMNTENAQIVFLDTPGIHKPQHKLGEYMVRTAERTLQEVDVILFVIDVSEKRGTGDNYILELLMKVKTPVILVANKIDRLKDKGMLLPLLEDYGKLYDFAAVVPVSAKMDKEFTYLIAEIVKHLPEGEAYFGEDVLTDQPMRSIAAELIREKILSHTRDEVPHSIAVEIEEFKERDDDNIYIRAVVYVERESQKGIVIGAGGALLKKVGRDARVDIEALTGCSVYLDLWVKVNNDWRNKDKVLRRLGYRD